MKSTARIGSHPIHPMLIVFPAGLWTASVVFDVLASSRFLDSQRLHVAGFYMALAGCIGALLAAIPGTIDLFTVTRAGSEARRTGWIHGSLNIVALILFGVSVYTRWRPFSMNYTAWLTAFAGLALVAVSGWLGGSLVYDHKVGVPDENPSEARRAG